MPSVATLIKEITLAFVRGVTDPRITFGRRVEIVGGYLASGLRGSAGMVSNHRGARPEKRLVLWDFERCPHSRTVREALSRLDLDADVRPCPKGGTRFRPE